MSLFGIIYVRNFLLKTCERGVCNHTISTREGENPTNQKKKNLYSNFQIHLICFTGKNSFSPHPLHKEGGVGGQQRRTRQKLIHFHHTWALVHSRQVPSPTRCPSCRWDLACCTTSWGLISNTISLESACPYLLQSSCCGLLSARSKESLFQRARVTQRAGISLLWDGAGPAWGAEQQDHSSHSCKLNSAVLRARANQLSKAEPLFILCFCTPGSKQCFCSSARIERHPLFPTDQATAAKVTISGLFCLQSVKNSQELPPAQSCTPPCQWVEQSGSSRTRHNTQSQQTNFASYNKWGHCLNCSCHNQTQPWSGPKRRWSQSK